MKHHQLSLLKKDHRQAHSRSKYTVVENNKSDETSKECLDYLLTTASEDASSESPIDNMEVFSFSEEVHKEGRNLQSFKNFMECPIPTVSPSSSSSAITAHKDEGGKTTSSDSDRGMNSLIEFEMVISHLREARVQILNSVNVDFGSKSIVDALIDMVISNLDGMSGDNKDRLPPNLVTGKTHILFLLLATWILASVMFLLFSTRGSGSFTEPPPT